jgi:hypothetical protein
MGTSERINFRKFNGGPARPLEERFWEKVDIRGEDECWEWLASLNQDGYGSFRSTLAHIVSWKLANGEIEKGLYVCHKCDNPACVNPKHLFLGTQNDNMKDMVAKGRGSDKHGENNPKAKLSESDVYDIYRLHNAGFKKSEIAKKYKVSETAISYVLSGKSWSRLWIKVTLV